MIHQKQYYAITLGQISESRRENENVGNQKGKSRNLGVKYKDFFMESSCERDFRTS